MVKRPSSANMLQIQSKDFERTMFAQTSNFFENFLSTQPCGFRKDYNTQHCLLALLEKWKWAVDKGKTFGALLTNLSTDIDCLDHESLIASLNANAFSLPALKLVHNYLAQWKQRGKVNNTHSSWLEIIFGVPQSSILISIIV